MGSTLLLGLNLGIGMEKPKNRVETRKPETNPILRPIPAPSESAWPAYSPLPGGALPKPANPKDERFRLVFVAGALFATGITAYVASGGRRSEVRASGAVPEAKPNPVKPLPPPGAPEVAMPPLPDELEPYLAAIPEGDESKLPEGLVPMGGAPSRPTPTPDAVARPASSISVPRTQASAELMIEHQAGRPTLELLHGAAGFVRQGPEVDGFQTLGLDHKAVRIMTPRGRPRSSQEQERMPSVPDRSAAIPSEASAVSLDGNRSGSGRLMRSLTARVGSAVYSVKLLTLYPLRSATQAARPGAASAPETPAAMIAPEASPVPEALALPEPPPPSSAVQSFPGTATLLAHAPAASIASAQATGRPVSAASAPGPALESQPAAVPAPAPPPSSNPPTPPPPASSPPAPPQQVFGPPNPVPPPSGPHAVPTGINLNANPNWADNPPPDTYWQQPHPNLKIKLIGQAPPLSDPPCHSARGCQHVNPMAVLNNLFGPAPANPPLETLDPKKCGQKGIVCQQDADTGALLSMWDYTTRIMIESNGHNEPMAFDPMAFDLKGAGVRTSDRWVRFDLSGRGLIERFHDIASGTGVLVFDSDRSGVAGKNGRDLFGNVSDVEGLGRPGHYRDGFEALEALVRRAEKEKVLPVGTLERGVLGPTELERLAKAYGLGMRVGGLRAKTVTFRQAGVREIRLSKSPSRRVKDFDGQRNEVVRRDDATFVRADGSIGSYQEIFFVYQAPELRAITLR